MYSLYYTWNAGASIASNRSGCRPAYCILVGWNAPACMSCRFARGACRMGHPSTGTVLLLRRSNTTPHRQSCRGVPSLNGVHLFHPPLAQGKKRTLPRAKALQWGICFFRLRRKKHIPHPNGECEGTRFPHTPAGDTHWGCHPHNPGYKQGLCERY
jgi:hypothetical protein